MPLVIVALTFLWVLTIANYFFLTPIAEEATLNYLDESMDKALEIFVLSRTVNAGVSVLQETSFSLSPVGLGLSLPVGQVLDPINDATERISDLSVYSMGIILAQRIVVEMGSRYIAMVIGVVLLVATIFVAMDKRQYWMGCLQFVVLLFAVNASIPMVAFLGVKIDQEFFIPEINQNLASLDEIGRLSAEQISTESQQDLLQSRLEETGARPWYDLTGGVNALYEAVEKYWQQISQISRSTTKTINYASNHIGEILDSLTRLFALWIAKAFFQGLVLPMTAYLFIKLVFTLVFKQEALSSAGRLPEKLLPAH